MGGVAVILGSGLGPVADSLGELVHSEQSSGYTPIPGHDGVVSLHEASGTQVLVARGRRHLYEGITAEQATKWVRGAYDFGCRTLILTNMVGAVDPIYKTGKPVLIADHINLTGLTPLVGPQFIDLADAYSPRLRDLARKVEPRLWEATYAQLLGPTYETPAEIKMLKAMGVGLVGMSVAIETIQARALGMEVLAISIPADTPGTAEVTHQGVLDVAAEAVPAVAEIIAGVVSHLAADNLAYAESENRFQTGEVM